MMAPDYMCNIQRMSKCGSRTFLSFLFARKASKNTKKNSVRFFSGVTYLEQCNTRIRILERGKSAIRVGRDKRFLLQDAEIEEFLMIWNAEFFENDGDFPWVGALFLFSITSVSTFA